MTRISENEMRRILFLLTLVLISAIAADAFAQQCCGRRPLIRRSCSTTCCAPMTFTSQTTGTTFSAAPISSIPTNYASASYAPTNYTPTSYAPTYPIASPSGCCGQSSTLISQAPVQSFSNIPTAAIAAPPTNIVSNETIAPSTVVAAPQVQETYAPSLDLASQIVPTAPTQSPAQVLGSQIVNAPVVGTPVLGSPVVSSPVVSTSTLTPVASSSTFAQPQVPVANAVQPSYYMPTFTQTSTQVTQQYRPSTIAGNLANGFAQRKAQRAAQINLRGHLGGSMGGAAYEGVGWSNVSPQQAIESCCYWGQRTPADIGVARGNDGCWYACVLYR